ncbi:MAG: ketoacyl-ACP synthase III [Ignavibacteriae bacterium]|nr:ketoacyl-ACP synthase III [Ignavibacteriota bacterium]
MYNIKIVSTGLYIPPKVQTSAELAQLIGQSEDWIVSRTGVAERRIAEEPMDIIAAKAAKDAINGGEPPDCIINASTTPLQLIPDSSVFIQRALGYEGIPSWSVHSTCLSFIVALNSAAALIQGGTFRRILIISSETGTHWRNMKEPESASLFGDAAAAVVLEATPKEENAALIDWEMNTWPKGAELTEFRGGGTRHPPDHPSLTKPEDNLFSMQGSKVYRYALGNVKKTLTTLFERNKLKAGDIDWLVPHQASGHAVEAAELYGFMNEKVANIVSKYGNCIAASIPMTLGIYHKEGKIKRGDLCVLGGTGAGLSVAFTILRF